MLEVETVEEILRLHGNGLPVLSLYARFDPANRRAFPSRVEEQLHGVRLLSEDPGLDWEARLSLRGDVARIDEAMTEERPAAGGGVLLLLSSSCKCLPWLAEAQRESWWPARDGPCCSSGVHLAPEYGTGRTTPRLPARGSVASVPARRRWWPAPWPISPQVRQGGAGMSGVAVFERFFRSVARLELDKNDVKRFRGFVDEMVDDIAVAGRNSAKWNGRDVIAPQDLPITKGLQERIREFDKYDEADDIRDLLALTTRRPPADVTFSDDTEELLPELFGGLSIALARTFRQVDPKVVNPGSEHWHRATGIFRQLF
jgi:hypothetical protein